MHDQRICTPSWSTPCSRGCWENGVRCQHQNTCIHRDHNAPWYRVVSISAGCQLRQTRTDQLFYHRSFDSEDYGLDGSWLGTIMILFTIFMVRHTRLWRGERFVGCVGAPQQSTLETILIGVRFQETLEMAGCNSTPPPILAKGNAWALPASSYMVLGLIIEVNVKKWFL